MKHFDDGLEIGDQVDPLEALFDLIDQAKAMHRWMPHGIATIGLFDEDGVRYKVSVQVDRS